MLLIQLIKVLFFPLGHLPLTSACKRKDFERKASYNWLPEE